MLLPHLIFAKVYLTGPLGIYVYIDGAITYLSICLKKLKDQSKAGESRASTEEQAYIAQSMNLNLMSNSETA